MEHTKRKIEELNLMDDFLFYEAVSGEQGEWFCRLLIQMMCQKKVKDIQIRPQNIIQGADTTRHGIRLDLYVDEAGICLYDFEPDRHTNARILPKRSRYYRALADGKLLDMGDGYEKMLDMWTIFILTHDPFGRDRICYTVKNTVLEEPDISYEDGAVTLYLYTQGHLGGNRKLSALLNYMESSTLENATIPELRDLHNYVMNIKHKKEVGVRYMKSWEIERRLREEGIAEGREEGRATGKTEDILDILGELGEVPEDLRRRIMNETNLIVLKQWVKVAARVQNISEFEEMMQMGDTTDITK